MKVKEIIKIWNSIHSIPQNTSLWWCIIRNKRILQPIVEEYNSLVKEIIKETAKKDKDGKPIEEGKGVLIDKTKEYSALVNSLLEEEKNVELFIVQLTEDIINEKLSPLHMENLIGTIIME